MYCYQLTLLTMTNLTRTLYCQWLTLLKQTQRPGFPICHVAGKRCVKKKKRKHFIYLFFKGLKANPDFNHLRLLSSHFFPFYYTCFKLNPFTFHSNLLHQSQHASTVQYRIAIQIASLDNFWTQADWHLCPFDICVQ